jgi:hypothetical protein
MTLDFMTMMEIDLIACRMAIEIDDTVAPATLFTDDLLRAAVKEYFSEAPEWRDDLLEPLLGAYRETQAIQNAALRLAESFIDAHYHFVGGRAG